MDLESLKPWGHCFWSLLFKQGEFRPSLFSILLSYLCRSWNTEISGANFVENDGIMSKICELEFLTCFMFAFNSHDSLIYRLRNCDICNLHVESCRSVWDLLESGKNFVKASMCSHRLVGEDGGNRLRPPLWIMSALMLGFVQVMYHAGCLLAIWLVAFLLTNATCTWTDDWLPAQLVERCVLIRIHQLRFPAMQFWILFLRLFLCTRFESHWQHFFQISQPFLISLHFCHTLVH